MVCCSIREQLLGLEESSCCSFSNAHFKQSSVKKFIGKERPELRLFSHLFVLILYILQGRPKDPSGECPGKRWDCIWSHGSAESLPPAISITNQLSQDPQPFAASQCNCA